MDVAISHCVDHPLVRALDEIEEDRLGGAKVPPLRNHCGGRRSWLRRTIYTQPS
jgi:hypothetical protein